MKTLTHYRNNPLRICLTVALLALASLSAAQQRHALVIGLGEQQDEAWGKVNGDRDVPLVRGMLQEAGFGDIAELVNQEATKEGIVKAMEALCGRCKRGDIVYVHFSGHGQQMTDLDGDEADGLDETWVPYDACRKPCERDQGERHLSDDEVYLLLSSIRKAIGEEGKLLVVIDACHSGDASRGEGQDDGAAVRGAWEVFRLDQGGTVAKTLGQRQEQWVTVSACKSYQNNEELRGKRVGKLTYALSELAKGGKRSNEEVEARLQAFMQDNPGRLPQTPEVTGLKGEMNITDVICK
ncbi:MAG: caspase family protein [Prevotellaceae bacterium]|nr:caspase family protein [Prevotellaceae bacterium]